MAKKFNPLTKIGFDYYETSGGGGVTDHNLLTHLDYATSGHTGFQPAGDYVTSVFGRTGDVVAGTNDFTWSQIDKTESNLSDITTKNHSDLTLDDGTNPHSTTASDVGLSNVTNVAQLPLSYLDIDGTLSADSDSKVPSQKAIKTYVDNTAEGKSWLDPVRDKDLSSPPVSYNTGDRYIVKATGSGDWSGHDNDITEWDGDEWVFTDPTTADTVVVEDESASYTWNGSSWVLSTPSTVYTASNGLTLVGSDFQTDLSDTNPSLEVSDGGLRAKVDDSSIERTSSGLSVKLVTTPKGGTGLTSIGTANQVLGSNSSALGLEYKSIVGGSNVTVTHDTNEIEISASVSGVADYLYTQVIFHSHLSSSYTWTNMPAAVTPIAIYQRANLTGAVQYRICTHQNVAGYAGADLNLQYSTDGTNWYACDSGGTGELDVGTGTGLKTGAWTDLVAGAKQDVRLRLVGKDGDGIVDPAWREMWVEFKYNASIVDLVSSDTVDKEITVHSHPASALTWTNMPAAVTEFLGSVYSRQRVDLSNCTHYRIVVSQSVAGYAGADLNLQYSLDGTTWVAADFVSGAGELDVGTGTGFKTGSWAALKDAAKNDVFLRLVGKDGNGVVDPAWRQVKVQFREHTYGQGVTGNNKEVLFNDDGATGTDSTFTFDKSTDVLGIKNFIVSPSTTQTIYTGTSTSVFNSKTYPSIGTTNSEDVDGIIFNTPVRVNSDFSTWEELLPTLNYNAEMIIWNKNDLEFVDGETCASIGLINSVERTSTNSYTSSTTDYNLAATNEVTNNSSYSGSSDLTCVNTSTQAYVTSGVSYDSTGQTGTQNVLGIDIELTATDEEVSGTLNSYYSGIRINVDSSGTDITNGTYKCYGLHIDSISAQSGKDYYGIYDESGAPWLLNGEFNCGDATTKLTISQVTDPLADLTGTFTKISATDSVGTNALILQVPTYFIGTSSQPNISTGALKITSGVIGSPTISTDSSGNNMLNVHACMFARLNRSGTIDQYGTDSFDFNISHYFGINNNATYAGSNDYIVFNAGVYGSVTETITSNPVSSNLSIINIGGSFDIYSAPLESVVDSVESIRNVVIGGGIETDGALDTDMQNLFMNISSFSTDSTHNVSIYDTSGYPHIIGTDNAPLRFGAGSTDTSWYENAGDAELYYDGTDFICNPKRIGSGAFKITGDLKVDDNTTLGNSSTDTITCNGRLLVRTVGSDPKDATPANRPAGSVGEIAYYSGKLYICTDSSTPTWEQITSS